MYQIPSFKDNDPETVYRFLAQHPLCLLTGQGIDGKPVATHLPMLTEVREGTLYLQGHLMRQTDHYRAFQTNPRVLAVFSGPSAYVSARWYKDPHGGSTWNYMTVHVHGEIRFMEPAELNSFMQRLSLRFEEGDGGSPTVFDNLPQAYKDSLMPAIAGIEIRAENMDHTFKLSQNRDEGSYRNIIHQLEARGGQSAAVAEEMKARLPLLFPPTESGT